jgi:hypothetical protein
MIGGKSSAGAFGLADLLAFRLLSLLEEWRPEELSLGHGRPAEHRDSEQRDPES